MKVAYTYRLPLDEIREMSADDFDLLYKGIDMIESQDQLIRLKAMDWPNMNGDERKKYHKSLAVKAFEEQTSSKKLSNKELAEILRKR